jgi:alpha-glucoside transport system substrate-binding protein
MRYNKRVAAIAIASSLVFIAACGSDDGDGGSAATAAPTDTGAANTAAPDTAAPDTAAPGTAAPDTAAPGTVATGGDSLLNGEIKCEQQYAGKTVSVLSPVRNSENDPNAIQIFTDFWKPLSDCTGVKIDFQGTDQFEVQAPVLIQGGSPPDLIDFPQPGLLATLAPNLITLPDNVAAHTKDFIGGWEGLYTVDGAIKALPWRANLKSTVWYSPAAFEAKGYEVPTTLDEMKALSDKIVADGGTPWCAGIESGVATGWPITDWFEDFMLRINGPDVYDQWVAHEIPFNDPKVKAVADAVGSYLKNPDYIGGENAVKAIATTKFQDGGVPIATGDCYMHRQASFYSALFPKTVTVGPPDSGSDITWFYLPVAKAGDPKVMLGAGDLMAAGTDKPETWDALLYATSLDYAVAMANGHAELSPRNDVDPSSITDPMLASFAGLLSSTDTFRFDGSDTMPSAVGSGTFWTEATAWIVGESTEDMLDNIEASWPKS